MRSILVSAVVLSLLAPASVRGDELRPAVDPDDPCQSSVLPAVSADGRLVAVIRCWSDLSDASDVTFLLARARDGRVVRRIFLSGASTGGDDPTPPGLVRRAVRRANQVLDRGGFRSLVPMVDDRGEATHLQGALGAGFSLSYDADSGRLVVSDAGSGRQRRVETLEPFSAHPYCCGVEEDQWPTASCGLTPVVLGAWADAAASVVVVETAAFDGPDGCEQGPDVLVIALAR